MKLKDDEDNSEKLAKIKSYLGVLPEMIKDDLARQMTNHGDRKDSADKIITFAMEVLTDSRTQKLFIGRNCNIDNILKKFLRSADNLTHLTLSQKNANIFLEDIGKYCRNLEQLSIPEGSEEEVHWITPKSDDNEFCIKYGCKVETHGCPKLRDLRIFPPEETCNGNYFPEKENGQNDHVKVRLLKYFPQLKKLFCFAQQFDLKLLESNEIKLAELQFGYEIVDPGLDFSMMPKIFTNLRSIRVEIWSEELKYLIQCPKLEFFEVTILCGVEFPEELQRFLDQHPNTKNFRKLAFVDMFNDPIPAECFLSIARKCPNLEFFTFVAEEDYDNINFNLMGGKYFQSLKTLDLTYCHKKMERGQPAISKLLNLLLRSATQIEKIELYITVEEKRYHFQSNKLFRQLLKQNSLEYLNHLLLTDNSKIYMSFDTIKMISDLPKMKTIQLEKDGLTSYTPELEENLRSYAQLNNFDIVYSLTQNTKVKDDQATSYESEDEF